MKFLARKQIGITLTDETLERLEKIAKEMGLSKSQAISMLINKYFINEMQERGKGV